MAELSDAALRKAALDAAIKSGKEYARDSILQEAMKYYRFLTGGPKTTEGIAASEKEADELKESIQRKLQKSAEVNKNGQ